MAIDIKFTSDTSQVVREAKDMSKALDSVADELKDLGKEGKSVEDKVQDAFRGMAADAKKAGKAVGDDVKDGTRRAGEGLEELRNESAGTAREAAASFSSLEDGIGALQETAANALAGFGPAGMAAGLVAAVGIGLATTALQEGADKANAMAEEIGALAGEIRDAGGDINKVDFVAKMQDWGFAIQDTKEWWEIFQDKAKTGFDQIQEDAAKAGLDWTDAMKGVKGPLEDALKVQRTVNDELERAKGVVESKQELDRLSGEIVNRASLEELQRVESLEKLKEQTDTNVTTQQEANRLSEAATKLGKEEVSWMEKKLDLMNDMASKTEGAVSSELDLLDAIAQSNEELSKATNTYRDGTQASRDLERGILGNASALSEWGQKQVDAGQAVDVVNDKLNAYRDKLIDQATKFFGTRDAAAAYIDQILRTPKAVDTDVNLNGIPDAEEHLNRFINKPRSIPVTVMPDGTEVEKYFMSQQGRKVFIEYAPRGGGAISQ